MTDEELKQALEELNDTKTEQDIAITEKNIALMREERDAELRVCVKEFFEEHCFNAGRDATRRTRC